MIAMVLATASAFMPHMKPLHVTRPAIHANDRVVMMPKFLKDLFPDMDKPDDIFGPSHASRLYTGQEMHARTRCPAHLARHVYFTHSSMCLLSPSHCCANRQDQGGVRDERGGGDPSASRRGAGGRSCWRRDATCRRGRVRRRSEKVASVLRNLGDTGGGLTGNE